MIFMRADSFLASLLCGLHINGVSGFVREGSNKSTSNPVMMPETNATSTRIPANAGPISAVVARMESTPVCGVDVRKEVVAPLLAPLW